MNIIQFIFASLNPSNFSWDLLVFICFVVAVFIYGISMGKNRLILVLIASYLSYIIVKALPWKEWKLFLDKNGEPQSNILIFSFLALIIVIYFLAPGSLLGSAIRFKRKKSGWLTVLILSILQVGFLASIVVAFLPRETLKEFSSLATKFLLGPEAQFIWLVLPLVAVLFLRRGER